MDLEEHKAKHQELHHALDELSADMIQHTRMLPSQTTILELIKWSNEQQQNPTEDE